MAGPQHGTSDSPSKDGSSKDGAKRAARKAADAAERTAGHPWFERGARAGYAANGILHGVLGTLVFQLALGEKASADQTGALEEISRQPFGAVLLWACFAGCLLLGMWHLASAVFDKGGLRAAKRRKPASKSALRQWKPIARNLVLGVTFLAVSGLFARFAAGGSSSSSKDTRRFSADLMSTPGGSVLLLLLGATILGVGAFFAYKGIVRKFRDDVAMPSNPQARRAVQVLGVAGYIAKGAALGLLGLLFIVATLQHDPQESTGLDGALKSLRDQPYGTALLAAIGAGLLCYGGYLALRSRYARMD
ncbi:hypothetical protein NCCP1664_18650 [Zafaria cholistanensis]|uniref:DUF1206 domain-containing protein n=1 Tax=Zafaria cholistanensis TaxID=1682741 RepID=A0A5A7NRM5_9MICC|nr:DUF1206 domain-containing protein [Zafaria cholistanensis]GER23369.1 hypothetical protein NCCP1664_18650 [Zafaria cholistanensis]